MILILAEESDAVTDMVCNWLAYYQFDFKRINLEKVWEYEVEINCDDEKTGVLLKHKGKTIALEDIGKVWFRRGLFDFMPPVATVNLNPVTINSINGHFLNETKTLEYFLYHLLHDKNGINHPASYNYNKLIALHEARQLGIKIPSTIIGNEGKVFSDFLKDKGSCITKNIQDVTYIQVDHDRKCGIRTRKVEKTEITNSQYWYSLFQEEIIGKYELRIFYFMGELYSMATIPSDDLKNDAFPLNRMVPYNLPFQMKGKLKKLMRKLHLESGSIDMIVDKNDDFYFLEVNPVGQFHHVRQICNYYLEKKISKHLCHE